MMFPPDTCKLYQIFAQTLEYPSVSTPGVTTECVKLLSACGLRTPMPEFADFIKGQKLAALEELYSSTFDMTPAATLYMGYHLFGETPKRSVFLIKLQEAYQAHNFDNGRELADYLPSTLRFISIAKDKDFVLPLLQDCLLPNLNVIGSTLEKTKNPYRLLTNSLHTFIEQQAHKLLKTGDIQHV